MIVEGRQGWISEGLQGMISEGWKTMIWEAQGKYLDMLFVNDGEGFFFKTGTGLAWSVYFVFSTCHYSAYFNLMGTAGLVTITATKSLVTAGYVALSAFAFCNPDHNKLSEYCLTHTWLRKEMWLPFNRRIDVPFPPFVQGTVVSAVACLAGVILY